MNTPKIVKHSGRLHDQIGYLVYLGQYRHALNFLDKVIEDPIPLFQGEDWVLEERRLAWLYRIDLLREWGKHTEALAWACLEAEMDPDNPAAAALKEQLKREARLLPGNTDKARDTPKTDKKPITLWKGVAGMRVLKAMLERDVILPLQEPEVYARYRLNLPNGILMYGPPGCGKTFIARKLAQIAGYSFIEVAPSDIASIYVHGTQGKIAEVFANARKQTPCMIFFDELDAMVPTRTGKSTGSQYSASEVNEFLVQLNECGKKKILVIGATNLPERIDPAIRRPGRLDKKFFVGPPDYEARVEMVRISMADRPQDPIDWDECARHLENYTSAEIDFIVNEAARTALAAMRNIKIDDISQAITSNPPTYSAADMEKMRSI